MNQPKPKIILAYGEAPLEITTHYDASLNANGRALTEYGVNVLKEKFKSRLDVDLDATQLKSEVVTEPRGSQEYALEVPTESPLQHKPVLIRYSTARGVNPLVEKIVGLNRQQLLNAEEAKEEQAKKKSKKDKGNSKSPALPAPPLLHSQPLPSSSSSKNREGDDSRSPPSPVQSHTPLPASETVPSSSSSMDFASIKAMFDKFEHKLGEQGKEIAVLRNDNEALRNDNEALRNDNETLRNDNETLRNDNVDLRNDNVDLRNDNVGLKNRISKLEDESKASIRDFQKRNNELERDLKHVKQKLDLTTMAASGDKRAITKIRLRILADLALRMFNLQGLELFPAEKLDAFVRRVGVPDEYVHSIVKAKRLGNDVAHNADSRIIAQGVLASDEDFRVEAKALFFLCYQRECDSSATERRYDYVGPPIPDNNRV